MDNAQFGSLDDQGTFIGITSAQTAFVLYDYDVINYFTIIEMESVGKIESVE